VGFLVGQHPALSDGPVSRMCGKKLSKNFNPRGTPFLIFQFLRQKIIR
jgi:hypothetical protein